MNNPHGRSTANTHPSGPTSLAHQQQGPDWTALGEKTAGRHDLTWFWNRMLALQDDATFTDLTLLLGPDRVAVSTSQLLVASLSPVFETMLKTDMLERRQKIVCLETITVENWNSILGFFLLGKESVKEEDVESLIAIADLYKLVPFKKHCEDVWIKRMSADNCIHMYQFAGLCCDGEVKEKIAQFLRDNFEDACMSEGFLGLRKDQLLEILQGSYITVTEDSLCTSILAWIKKNDVDEDTASYLIRRLRLKNLSRDCLLKQLMYHPRVVQDQAFQETLIQEVQRRINPESALSTPSAPYRRMLKEQDGIMVVGVINGTVQVYYSNTDMQNWQTFPSNPGRRGMAACVLDKLLYVTGGSPESKKTYVFLMDDGVWTKGPDLLRGRTSHGMVAIGDTAYVVMGCARMSPVSCIEALSQSGKTWNRVGHMVSHMYLIGVSHIGDTIITAGTASETGLNMVQVYDVRTGAAAILNSPKHHTPQSLQAASLEDKALFLGITGLLITVSKQANGELLVAHKQLRNFGTRRKIGLLVSSHLTAIPSEWSSSMCCYTLDGETMDGLDPAKLPSPIEVRGVFRFHLR